MSEQKITFRTDTITAFTLKENAEQCNLTISAFINFIIKDYEKLKKKIETEEKTGYVKNTLDKIFQELEMNNSICSKFLNVERENIKNRTMALGEDLKDKTERYEKLKKMATDILNESKRLTELFFSIINRYKLTYEDVVKTYLNNEYCNSEKSPDERKHFLETVIKSDFPERKKGLF